MRVISLFCVGIMPRSQSCQEFKGSRTRRRRRDAARCVPECRAPDAFQLYARNDPKQVPRRNVHIISRPDASKGAGYDFIRAAPS